MSPGIIVLLLIVFIASSLSSKKKNTQGTARTTVKTGGHAPVGNRMQSKPEETEEEEEDRPMIQAAAPAPYRAPLTATVAPTMHDHSDMYAGSMGDVEDEGFDPHDHGFEAAPNMPSMHSEAEINASLTDVAEEEEEGGFSLRLDGDSLMQAFVLQEVLKRPADRKR
jgi:hypothetical protein